MQDVRLAGEAASGEARARMKEAAFVGWQVRSSVLAALGSKSSVPFDRYLRMMGLGDQRKKLSLPSGDAARQNAERVREAFRRFGVRKQAVG